MPEMNDAIRRYIENTPLMEVQRMIYARQIDWKDNARSPTKAYIMACLSEISYLCVPGYALKNRDRYMIVPSATLAALNGDDASFGLAEICCYLLGLGLRLWDRAEVGLDVRLSAAVAHLGDFIFVVFFLPSIEYPEFVVITVRGTAPVLKDVLIDLDERMLKVNGRGYHRGFYEESKTALPDLVKSVTGSDVPLYFTGHSLGGAVAGILPQVWPAWPKLMTPYTFASPRFGDEAVADPATHPVYAYVRAKDPIPHVPLERSGYRSSGWPPTMVPLTDSWLEGLELFGLRAAAHGIEGYRMLLGDEIRSRHFAPLVYFEELKARLTREQIDELRNEIRWRA